MAGEIHLIKKMPAGRGRADCDGSVRGCSESEMAFKRKSIVKKKKNIVTIIFAAALCLLITACSSEIEKLAVSDQEYADYAASFDVQGNDAENRNTTFQYQGTMELKDGTIVMTFESGAVMT